ncbi:MAG: serine/threonine-protein kinase [Gemmatimonadaceae bacterium]
MTAWTAERWRRVSAVLDEVLDAPPERRQQLLNDLCAGDDALRNEVLELLDADQRAESFLATPASVHGAPLLEEPRAPNVGSDVGRVLGPWRLISVLGEGGMGRVYVAERADGQYAHEVAVKMLKAERLGTEARARFLHERQILAQLDHPKIARLLDGGVTPEGLPYFVMELVDGRPITTYVQDTSASLRRRLELFLEVCEAVRYAHTRLVVHRDLKPSNILIDRTGHPRLLDFGIAKLLSEDGATARVPETQTVARLMTPEYAAPEQLRGDPITTATDVWALGVLLFELLTGRRPFLPEGRLPGTLEQAIVERDPPRPATVVDPSFPYPGRLLRGDLDRIILTALQKEPGRRYASVDAVVEDIRRYLDGRPVLARGDGLGYRAGKFLRRNRLGVAAGGIVALAVVGGLVATAQASRRATAARTLAEQRLGEVRRLVNALLYDFNDAVTDLPGAAAARARVSATALEYLDGIAAQGTTALLDAELAAAYERVGDVAVAAGDPARATRSYERAYGLRRNLAARALPARLALVDGVGLRRLGDALFLGDARDSALTLYRQALRTSQGALASNAADSAAGHAVVDAAARVCDRADPAMYLTEALSSCRLATTVGAPLLAREPNHDRFRAQLAAVIGREDALLASMPQSNAVRSERADAAKRTGALAQADLTREPRVGTWRLRPKGSTLLAVRGVPRAGAGTQPQVRVSGRCRTRSCR